MLGILDIIMASTGKVTKKERLNAEKFFKYSLNRESDLTWICFLPRRTTLDIAQKYGLLPKKGNIIAYEVPLNLIASNPELTREAFFDLIEDFKKTYNKKIFHDKDVSFLGISVGSMPAIYLANRYKAKKLRLICSTAKLGEGIFGAFAARKIKKEAIKNGIDSEKYDNILDEINPIRNISNLPNDTKIVISRFDKYIPFRGGSELVKSIIKINKNVKVYKFLVSGHFLTMFRVGKLNKKNDFLN